MSSVLEKKQAQVTALETPLSPEPFMPKAPRQGFTEPEFADLLAHIQAFTKGKPFYYFANAGNWGDGLIRYATLEFFKQHQLPFKEIFPGWKNKLWPYWVGGPLLKRKVLYGGNGAFNPYYPRAFQMVRKLNRYFDVGILPSTYAQTYTLEADWLFVRDSQESQANMPGHPFCHDMALALQAIDCSQGEGAGYFLRTDVEQAEGVVLPTGNRDLSTEGNHYTPMEGFFKALAPYRTIVTDRLHVAIGASLLNKEVHMFSNSYFKNRAIYQSSLKHRFPKLNFHEQAFDLDFLTTAL